MTCAPRCRRLCVPPVRALPTPADVRGSGIHSSQLPLIRAPLLPRWPTSGGGRLLGAHLLVHAQRLLSSCPLQKLLLHAFIHMRLQIVISWEKKYDGDQLLHPVVLAPEQLPAGIGQVGASPGAGWCVCVCVMCV